MDQLTEKPITPDQMYDKAVAEAKAAKKKYPQRGRARKKHPQPDLQETETTVTLPITPYSPPRKRIAFKANLTEEMANKITMYVMMGETLKTIELLEGMPSEGTMQWWLINNIRFRSLYARACVYRADNFEEQIIDLSNEAAKPENYLAVRGYEVKIKTLQWVMARLNRKRWGDHVTVDITPVDLTAMDREASETFMKLLEQMTPRTGEASKADHIEAEDIPTTSET